MSVVTPRDRSTAPGTATVPTADGTPRDDQSTAPGAATVPTADGTPRDDQSTAPGAATVPLLDGTPRDDRSTAPGAAPGPLLDGTPRNRRAAPGAPAVRSDEELAALAQRGRWLTLQTVARNAVGHVGGPMSAMDMLVTLYFDTLRRDPATPADPDRDRFILSKGHNAIALYAVMAMRGYLPEAELDTFDQGDSRLQGHPDVLRLPGLDASTGSLGQGLALGVGMALEARRQGKDFTTFVMIGDGEHQEGMVWESVLCASRYRLDNLVAVIDRNGLQQFGWAHDGGSESRFDRLDPWAGVDLAGVYRSFGWDVVEVDGHDIPTIRREFATARDRRAGRPTVVIATTAKGRGASFTEGTYAWHNGVPTPEQLDLARRELGIDDGGTQ